MLRDWRLARDVLARRRRRRSPKRTSTAAGTRPTCRAADRARRQPGRARARVLRPARGRVRCSALQALAQRQHASGSAKRNIVAHYDLGNEFYALWLDPTMTYSSALFDGDLAQPLADAQQAKYERMLAELALPPARTCSRSAAAGAASPRPRRAPATASPASRCPTRRRPTRASASRAPASPIASTFRLAGLSRRARHLRRRRVDRDVRSGRRALLAGLLPRGARRAAAGRRAPASRRSPSPTTRFERYRDAVRLHPAVHLPRRHARLAVALRRRGARGGTRARAACTRSAATTRRRCSAGSPRSTRNVDAVRAQGFDDAFIRCWRFYLAYCAAGFATGPPMSRSTRSWRTEHRFDPNGPHRL